MYSKYIKYHINLLTKCIKFSLVSSVLLTKLKSTRKKTTQGKIANERGKCKASSHFKIKFQYGLYSNLTFPLNLPEINRSTHSFHLKSTTEKG